MRQTPKSYIIAMEGMAHAASRQVDIAIVTSWHTARFALNGWADKGRLAGNHKLSDLLTQATKAAPDPEDENRIQNARAIHFFNSLKARGADIKVERVVH